MKKEMKLTFLKYLTVLTLLVLSVGNVSAQQESLFSQYMFNRLAINPAYAGTKGLVSLTALYRTQWTNDNGTPHTFSISGHGANRKKNGEYGRSGFGAYVLTDQNFGFLQQNSFGLSYSYKIPFTFGTLSFGIKGEAMQWQVDGSKINTFVKDDPTFPKNTQNVIKPNFGAGIFFNTGKFYIGGSVANLTQPKMNMDGYVDESKLARHFYLTAGYDIALDKEQNWILTPSFFLRNAVNTPVQADLNMNLMMIQKFWVGASYRSGTDAVVFLAGFYPCNRLRIGYSYDATVSGMNKPNYTGGSHEIMLSYDFGNPNKTRVVTPRYF